MTDQSSQSSAIAGTVAARRRSSAPSWRCWPRSAIEDIGFAEIARRAGVSLSELRVKYSSKIEMLAAHMREVDRAVLDGIDAGMADEPPRERLFDVLMRRLDLARAGQGGGAIAAAFGDAESRPGAGAQRPDRALDAMDADRRRHLGVRAEGHGARAGSRAAVRLGAAHLGRMTTIPARRARSPRSTARCRAASAGPACSTICCRIPEAACNARRAFGRRRGDRGDSESAAA